MSSEYDPAEDGVTHLNVYSRARTELGRFLSNFAYFPQNTPDGPFVSIEGYWYWLSGSNEDKLRQLSGYKAKQYGRAMLATDWCDEEWFKNNIRDAITEKIATAPPRIIDMLTACELPLVHYYCFKDHVVVPSEGQWVIDHIDSLRKWANKLETVK